MGIAQGVQTTQHVLHGRLSHRPDANGIGEHRGASQFGPQGPPIIQAWSPSLGREVATIAGAPIVLEETAPADNEQARLVQRGYQRVGLPIVHGLDTLGPGRLRARGQHAQVHGRAQHRLHIVRYRLQDGLVADVTISVISCKHNG